MVHSMDLQLSHDIIKSPENQLPQHDFQDWHSIRRLSVGSRLSLPPSAMLLFYPAQHHFPDQLAGRVDGLF